MEDRNVDLLTNAQKILTQVRRVVVGKNRVLTWVLAAILAKGHILMEDIPGVGPKRRKALLNRLGSLKAIREASLEELLAVPGMSKPAAEAVLAWARASTEKKK